jgi:ATP-dependent exoDNAse (exonuclease V) beta subunit
VESAATGVASAIAAASAAHDRARQPSWSATSVTAEAKRLPRVTLGSSDDVQDDDPTRGVVADTPSRRADAGMAWGTLIHGLLEHAMRYRAATRDDLRRLAMWLTVEEPLLRTLVDQALDTVEAVKAGDFWQAARASSEAHEEAPFSRLQPDPAVPNVLSGTIDLVYRDGGEWRIVDYKTDADFASTDLTARHRAQMQAYEQAWGQVARAPVKARIVGAR